MCFTLYIFVYVVLTRSPQNKKPERLTITSSRLIKDPEVCDPIRFLRKREIVHYQRFGESLRIVTEHLDSKNYYAFNPEFDCN